MSTTAQHDIVTTDLSEFARELRSRLLDGWDIHPSNRGEVVGLYGGNYTITLYRNTETVAQLRAKAADVQDAPKPDRAAILANARAAKAAKAQEGVKKK